MGSGVKTVSLFTSQGCWGGAALTARLNLKVKVDTMAMVICLSSHHAFLPENRSKSQRHNNTESAPVCFCFDWGGDSPANSECLLNSTDQARTLHRAVVFFLFTLNKYYNLIMGMHWGYEFTELQMDYPLEESRENVEKGPSKGQTWSFSLYFQAQSLVSVNYTVSHAEQTISQCSF